MYVFVLLVKLADNFIFILISSNASTKLRNWYTHYKTIIISSLPPGMGKVFFIAPTMQMYQVVHRPCVRPHPCNVPSNGDSSKKYRGDIDNLSMCKSSYKPETITDALETSYA